MLYKATCDNRRCSEYSVRQVMRRGDDAMSGVHGQIKGAAGDRKMISGI